MSEYTPSEAERHAELTGSIRAWHSDDRARLARFDRWLAFERARIWAECDAAIVAHVERNGTSAEGWPVNPYRKDGDGE